MRKSWGFDTRTIDRSVRPQDDFYRYANGGWLKRNRIPSAESRWGTFIMLRYDTERKLRALLGQILKKDAYKKGASEQLVADLYHSAADLKAREKLGITPVTQWHALIAGIRTKEDFLRSLALLHRSGVSQAFFDVAVDQDFKRSTEYILYLSQGGLGMPERDYYLLDKPEQKRVREAYREHIRKLCRLFGVSADEAEKKVGIVMRIETELAKASMDKVSARDPEKIYHRKTLAALQAHSPALELKKYIKRIGAGSPRSVILCQPRFFEEVERIIVHTTLSDLKTYLEWTLLNETASVLSSKFVREHFHFYSSVLMGTKKMKPLWRRALAAVNGRVPDELGRLYVAKYFTPKAKKMMDTLVDHLFDAYKRRIKELNWMSPETKKKALKKLRMMTRKIGYPSRWKSYKGLEIRADDYAGNMMRSAQYEQKRAMRKLGKKMDRTEWFMSPQTVNAYFNPGMNEIVFPAAILQRPFFDAEADDAVNYGAIGYTIGHEITHSFDDQGSKFDGKGNLRTWWTKADRKRFERKAALIAKQFDAFQVAPGIHVNGKLTLGENIADLGGISIAFDAYQKRLQKTGRKVIDGWTPEQRFFFGCAQGERELSRPEFLKMAVLTDPHSPAEFRVNGPFSNLPEFYVAFGVKKGDRLYRKAQAKIW